MKNFELPFPRLLEELKNYNPPISELGRKAQRVYFKCERRGKTRIMKLIFEKYKHLFPVPDDRTQAAILALRLSLPKKRV